MCSQEASHIMRDFNSANAFCRGSTLTLAWSVELELLNSGSIGNEDLQRGITGWQRDLTGGNHKKRCRKINQEDAKPRSQKTGGLGDGATWPSSPQAQENECLQRAGIQSLTFSSRLR